MIDWGTVLISALLGSIGGAIISLYSMYRFLKGFIKEYESLNNQKESSQK